MSFQPIVPFGGYTGWLFMQRTIENQQKAFDESFAVTRATDYFRENISAIDTAEELIEDRRLREVALGAFGLDDDIDSNFFIKTILEEGTLDDEALANRLADPRYAKFAEAFGFDLGVPLTKTSVVVEDIVARYEDRQFERAVGNVNNDIRLALNVSVGLDDVISTVEANDSRWFAVMGNSPLRQVVQTAFGLPTAIAAIDIDKQLEIFKERSESILGTSEVSDLTDPDMQDTLIRLFLIRSEAASQAASFSSGSVALTLLRA